MSFKIASDVAKEHPDLLPTNLGRTCFQYVTLLRDRLRQHGHEAYLMCKTGNEGRYVPPGFKAFEIVGLDGTTTFLCTGFSHDAIWCDGQQFDTVGSANEYDRPIYRRVGDPNWSFDPADGPRITASPTWDEIDPKNWRNNNPPYKGTAPIPGPTHPPATAITFPPRDMVGRFFGELDALYARKGRGDRTHGRGESLHVDNEGLFVWLSEFMRHFAVDHPTASNEERYQSAAGATIADIEKVWR